MTVSRKGSGLPVSLTQEPQKHEARAQIGLHASAVARKAEGLSAYGRPLSVTYGGLSSVLTRYLTSEAPGGLVFLGRSVARPAGENGVAPAYHHQTTDRVQDYGSEFSRAWTLFFWFPKTTRENDAMPPRTDPETATLLTQIATTREALRKICNLAVEPGADPMEVLLEAQWIADEALREAGLRPQ